MTSTKTRRVLYGDNGKTLTLVPDASIDMIYMDPPFGSDREYTGKHGRGFSDVWSWGDEEKIAYEDLLKGRNPVLNGVTYDTLSDPRTHGAVTKAVEFSLASGDERFCAYVLHMGVRLIHYKRVLKDTGNLIIHCDQTASHIIKAMVDAAFGRKTFRNEIIWKRTNAKGLQTKRLARNHDVILTWGRTQSPFYNNEVAFFPYDLENLPASILKQYDKIDADGRRYCLGDLTNPNPDRPNLRYELMGVTRTWRWSKERMERAVADGRVVQSRPGAVPVRKAYLDEMRGMPFDDIWTDIGALSAFEAERLGYPTQKPVALLERLIRLYSPEGGHVLDPFGGCGTTADAAEGLGRSWTVCDISIHAIDVVDRRMTDAYGIGEKHGLVIEGDWPGTDLAKIDALPAPERRRYLARLIGAASLDTDRRGDQTQLDRGIHGHFSIKDFTGKPPHGILMIAPTGGNATDVEVLKRLRVEDGAQIAVLVCDTITDRMCEEAAKTGDWPTPGTLIEPPIRVDRVQFVTVADVVVRGLADALPSGVRLNLPYVPAKKREPTLSAA